MTTMNVAITGASGMIGTRLAQQLVTAGATTRVISRQDLESDTLGVTLSSCDAVVHLAGEPVAQRWSDAVKQRIYDSRVETTRRLVAAMAAQVVKPRVLVCASAVGYYGSRGDQVLTERSSPGSDFLANVVVDWETAAQSAEASGIRVVRLRLGVVLGQGGALARLLPPFRFGAGGRLGSGKQWMAWIHIDDVVRLILFALNYTTVQGPVNATAPHPVTNEEFTERLAKVLHRPAILPVPDFALKIAFGEMSGVLLGSQRVLPTVAKSAGFRFQYPELSPALENLLAGPA